MSRFLVVALCLTQLASCASPGPPPPTRSSVDASPACGEHGVAVQVLGSGGPIADDARASAGYLVWVDGEARLVVDMGGGTFQRLGAARARARDLRAVLLTHYHVDHTSDLPALLKSASFGKRDAPLPVVGPSGSDRFPSLEPFVHSLVGADGAWPYLSGYVEGADPFALSLREVDVDAAQPATVLDDEGLVVRAIGVPHGPVPALAYLVEVAGARVGFTGDQRMDEPRFHQLVDGADLLIAHHAIPEEASAAMRALHARPSQIGEIAARAKVRALVLSHHMRRSLDAAEQSLALIRERYDGPVTMANDLDCFAVRR
jgi:ribonuclease BN (tRNA processing enzyme)